MTKLPSIVFVGLGNMGFPMACNLVKAGYTVYGVDTDQQAEQRFVGEGGEVGHSIQSLSKHVDIIMTSLPNSNIVEKVFFGENGIIEQAHSSMLIIDFSTISPGLNKEVADVCTQKGISYLAAPISGGVIGAENATLTIMVGGEKVHYDKVYSLFQVLGSNIFHIGEEHGAGTIVKLINNLMIGFYTQAVAEAVTLGEQMGVDPDKLFEILNVSYGQSRIYERNYKSFIAKNNFQPGFTTNLLLKDLRLAKQMAEECNALLPIGDKLIDLYSVAVENGYGEMDMASVYLMLKEKLRAKNQVS